MKSKQEHFSISTDKYNKIVQALRLQRGELCEDGPKFKMWCKKKFKLEHIGSMQIVYCTKASCPVVTYEEMFETIRKCHEKVGHSGRDKTWSEVRANYAGIKHSVLDIFLKTCTACTQRQPSKSPPAGRPMINLEFLLRLQIDLVDMRSQPDGEFKWILHARDHFTKFSWLYPMKTKMAAEVADHLITQFCVFGSPRIMQSDNGKEFTARVINDLSLLWPGMVIIHGRPRHPESQGCVERGNEGYGGQARQMDGDARTRVEQRTEIHCTCYKHFRFKHHGEITISSCVWSTPSV
ncbi:hypothetical protein V1264_005490 [Littorina saxatilis]|uniref:Integrase catalytic domain-containing protein n=1 Tax=Littorina saxatilis TaxID=31220 RepID=A0AAN9AZL0_9CAEN